MKNEVPDALKTLAAEIGGEIKDDGELYYGQPDKEIYITALGNGGYTLASEDCPLYEIKRGKPRRVRRGTKGEDEGWYYATASSESVRTILDMALGATNPESRPLVFAYEHALRDHLAHSLDKFEEGLSLYNNNGRKGIGFPTDGRFIDVLAVDKSGNFVVFELKLSLGQDQVLGQILDYISWVKQHLATSGQKVRGVIIARKITEHLQRAVTGQPDVTLAEYSLEIRYKTI